LPAIGSLAPADVVVNPDAGYPFPYSDAEMLTGAVSFARALDFYRAAYSLRAGSPAIDAGAPQDSLDSLVSDRSCDIGALEYGGLTAARYAIATDPGSGRKSQRGLRVAWGCREPAGTLFDVFGRVKPRAARTGRTVDVVIVESAAKRPPAPLSGSIGR
jgi:hypothetical protein